LEQYVLLAKRVPQALEASVEPLLRFDQEPLFGMALILGFSQLLLKSGFILLTR